MPIMFIAIVKFICIEWLVQYGHECFIANHLSNKGGILCSVSLPQISTLCNDGYYINSIIVKEIIPVILNITFET